MNMSRLAKRNNNCNCVKGPDCGIISLQVVGAPSCLTENKTQAELRGRAELAKQLQRQVIPHLHEVPCHAHQGGFHSHPPRVSDVGNLIEPMDQHNLSLRITHLNHGIDEQAQCAEVTKAHLQHLINTGAVTVDAPTGAGKFHLASSNRRSVTEMHYTPN